VRRPVAPSTPVTNAHKVAKVGAVKQDRRIPKTSTKDAGTVGGGSIDVNPLDEAAVQGNVDASARSGFMRPG
jgi:hypothetical protein